MRKRSLYLPIIVAILVCTAFTGFCDNKVKCHAQPSPRVKGSIQPNADIQHAIDAFRAECQNIPVSARKLSRREQFDLWQTKLLPLRFHAKERRYALLEQLLWRYAVKRDMAWPEFGFLVQELNLTRRCGDLRPVWRHVMSPDPWLRYFARDMIYGEFRQYGTDEVLTHFAGGEAFKKGPDEYTALLFHIAPMEMVTRCIRNDGVRKQKLLSEDQRKEVSWAIRQVDTGLWKRQNGFLERKKVAQNPYQSRRDGVGDPDAVIALALLSEKKQPWYARLFVLEIMAQHPEYQDEAILLRLSKDPVPIVSRLARKTLALNLAPQLDRAVHTGDIEAVKKLLAKPGVMINAGLPLIKAVQRGDLKMVRFLLDQGADPDWRGHVRSGFPLGDGAVMVAVSRGQRDTVRLLVKHGAKLEWTHAGQTPQSAIYTAILSQGRRGRHGRPDWQMQKTMLALLVELGADVNGVRPNLGQPAECAIALGCNEALRFLIDHKADLSVRTGQEGTPLLVSAAYNGNVEAMKLLLEQGADINAQSRREKRTALMSAVRAYDVDAVRWLLEHKADVTLKDRTGRTAIDYSKRIVSISRPPRSEQEKTMRDNHKIILELLKGKPTTP